MKSFIAPLVGVAVVVGAAVWWGNRPYPDWRERTAAEAGVDGATVAAFIVGRDGAEDAGQLQVACAGGKPTVAFHPGGRVQFVGGGSVDDPATMPIAAHFRTGGPGGPSSAPVQDWLKPAGKGFFEAPDSVEHLRRLAESDWLTMSPSGTRGVTFHVRRLGAFRERILSQCVAGEPGPPAGG